MNDQIAMLFAKRFIQRRDVKAVQLVTRDKVIYSPDRELRNLGSHGPLGFVMEHLANHLDGTATYGHYLLDHEDNARMFCFDVDLKTEGFWIPMTPFEEGMDEKVWEAAQQPIAFNPRDSWLDRAHPSRNWVKSQMSILAHKLCSAITRELGIGCAAAYSGNKGIHVYGFTGPANAADIRVAAHYVLEATGDWELERGEHIYRYKLQEPFLGYPNFNLEVYPKQDSLENKDLGNLLRLPLGKNLKNHEDPTFFLDLARPIGQFAPHPNPVQLLETGDPFVS